MKHILLSLILVMLVVIIGCHKNKPPDTPTITGSTTGNTNVTLTFDVQSTDPDKDDISYKLSWGDGTTADWSAYFPSGQSIPKIHAFSNPGNYSIMAKAKDIKEQESDWSSAYQVSISSRAPNTPSTPDGPSSGDINTSYSFSSSTTDPDGDSIAIRFDWGNGTISSWSSYMPSGTIVSMSYSYPNTGTYDIKAQAKDNYGSMSVWSSPHSITMYGWVTMLYEGFEGAFPGTTWTLYGSPTWDDESYRHNQGYWSGWCAGSTLTPPGPYTSNMNAWMIYGPFSLTDASYAYFSFYRWLNSESGYDFLFWGASINGTNFYGNFLSGNYSSWNLDGLDLTNVPTLGNLCGQPYVWIGFKFSSDATFQYEGAYLDDIGLAKYTGSKALGKSEQVHKFTNAPSEQTIEKTMLQGK